MDISETGLEALIVAYLCDNNGYEQLEHSAYNKDYALVEEWLETFITATQPMKVQQTMCFASSSERTKFLSRLREAITKRGITDVLRKGYKFNGTTFDLYFPLPSELNNTAKQLYAQNIFGVIRQVHYSKANDNSIDFVIFINGFPLATFELKNKYTGQCIDNAIAQYKNDRKPEGEILLQKGRCAVHMAVDDNEVAMCTELRGKDSWFLPFNRGLNGGAGNPPIDGKTMTSYLWEEVLTKESLSDIIENFAQIIKKTNKKKVDGRTVEETKEQVIWPRFHQLDAVRSLLKATRENPVGRRFLIQHSAGSGKSNSISWLAYQLVLLKENQQAKFNSIIVVTDRVNLDKQIRDNINAFKKLQNIVGWADESSTLRTLLTNGQNIVITTIHKFKFILDEIGNSLKDKHFAIIIDEAHSSQSGAMSASLSTAISGYAPILNENGEPEDFEDQICRIIKGRKLAQNANYYAFTATPKNKTLEMFGEKFSSMEEGIVFRPFHEYTMMQAIQEGFILDVLRNYTPYSSYYRVMKAIEDDPQFDKKKASRKIRAFIESQPQTIKRKCEIIVDHFCNKTCTKIGGKARAMIVTSSIQRVIEFHKVVSKLLEERGSHFKAIAAFTDKEINGQTFTASTINGFPNAQIEDKMEEEPYRILIVDDMFTTGYDQPLLHTMYVDKQLSDLKAVQTLSRLNRCHPKKIDSFVLDFCNTAEEIQEAFQKYYKTTILEGESDINKLNDLTDLIENFNFYTEENVDQVVKLYISGNDEKRPEIDAIIDSIVLRFKNQLEEEEQIKCKSAIKNYCRAYDFFSGIMPYESIEWEKSFIFYGLLLRKLPKLKIEDFTKGLLETIIWDKYRIVRNEEHDIALKNENTTINPIPLGSGQGKPTPEMDLLSNIVEEFNSVYGNIEWKNKDEVIRQIEELPARLEQNEDFMNAAKNGDPHTSELTFYEAMIAIVAAMAEEKTEFVGHYFDNQDFQNLVNSHVYQTVMSRIR